MRLLARWALRLVTAATSVFIAACYGVPYEDDGTRGRVVRAGTATGIAGINVQCLDGEAVVDGTLTAAEGGFEFYERCTAVAAVDVDADANGGAFSSRTVPVEDPYVLVELELAP